MTKVAFVVQRYGVEVNGGAELYCRWIAERMSRHWDIEVLTTCAVDYMTWRNEYEPGLDSVNGIPVRRFPVDEERDIEIFNELSTKLLGQKSKIEDELRWMRLQGPYSQQLFDFVGNNKDDYDFFFFFTYLYCTTFFGLPLVKEKALLVPTAHDEPPIHLKIFDDLFKMPRGFIFCTCGERDFLEKRAGCSNMGEVVGIGIDLPGEISGERFRSKYNISGDFIIYIGRLDPSKGCDHLFDYFFRYRSSHKKDIKLLLAGKPQMIIPESDDIIHLGFIPEQDKFDALDAARLLVIPSPYESLSMVTLESFFTKTPVLANGECLILRDQCVGSNGGLYYTNYAEFSESLSLLLDDRELSARMGRLGKGYVEENYNWEIIEQKYIEILNQLA